jgi:DNA-binding SARP family transcriptional activator
MNVDIKVLGTLEISVGGVSVVPTANKPSKLLALLALNVGHVVTTSTLIEEIWDQQPPRTYLSTLQTYVLKVRKKFEDAALAAGQGSPKDFVITKRNGYLLDVAPEDVDATEYTRLSKAGRRAANVGDYLNASRLLADALKLWRGPALTDILAGPHLAVEKARLEESHLGDLELRIDAELHLGRHHEVLGDLATLCARYPMSESFYTQHMLALYRSGRQWRALQTYRQIRNTTAEQLGIEPTPRLQRLHHAILCGDPEMDDPHFLGSKWIPACSSHQHAQPGPYIAAVLQH